MMLFSSRFCDGLSRTPALPAWRGWFLASCCSLALAMTLGPLLGVILASCHAVQLGKEQLLDALRFGADKVFRSKDTSITDADIDAIMEQGKVRDVCWLLRFGQCLHCISSCHSGTGSHVPHGYGQMR